MRRIFKMVPVLIVMLSIVMTLFTGCENKSGCDDSCDKHPESGHCHCHGTCDNDNCDCHGSH